MKVEQLFEQPSEDIPEIVISTYKQMADDQRNQPEDAMLRVQHINGGGILNPVVEHAGDIIHRTYEQIDRNNIPVGLVQEKCEKVVDIIRNGKFGIPFKEQMEQNIQNNAEYSDRTPEEQKEKVYKALDQYANEFRNMYPVYNSLQHTILSACILIGTREFRQAEQLLQRVSQLASNDQQFYEKALDYEMSNGQLVPFERSSRY